VAIDDRYERLLRRRAPTQIRELAKFAEAYETQRGKSTKYLLGAITPVDRKLTDQLREQGTRVENQLETRLAGEYPGLLFRRQGSVSNNTHIRYYSDVDVLTIIDKFVVLERPQQPKTPYQGEPKEDLLELRNRSAAELRTAFPQTQVDNTGSTSIAISGGSLICRVDVVPANWLNTNAYAQGQGDHTRGVQVLNKDKMEQVTNYPFLFNSRLDTHDRARNGLPRMLIRLLKTIKADHEEEHPRDGIALSSFDLCSIVYRMPDTYLSSPRYQPLDIIRNLTSWLAYLRANESARNALNVIDDSRIIFDSADKTNALAKLEADLVPVYQAAVQEQGGYGLVTESHLRDD
jgi:hypothetical protein